MDENDFLAGRFEEHRTHLRAVAYRMLGSFSEADDAIQDTWIRLSGTDVREIDNLGGWLTTVVARVSLNMLRSRRTRREDPLEAFVADPTVCTAEGNDPEHQAMLADSVGMALLVVLETLAPAERLAFVLHDMFALPFDEIAPIVDRTPTATRQLASRARRRVQGSPGDLEVDPTRQREVVGAFLAASRGGDFQALLALLDPDVVLRADSAAIAVGAMVEVRGAAAVAETFSGRAQAARPALLDGIAGLVWAPGGEPRVVFGFMIANGRIVGIDLLSDPAYLRDTDVRLLDG
ncbi:sigma-70 family RNA polymerase sigma factor [Embleya sp. NPDC059237]|uniref:sigma-70 family RNA polymerase sigma factor n=1 Tax=Embleya sp. NPDC059237 TaxID=3346784 RepID=UPI0036BFA123